MKPIRIASWNINSVRLRAPLVLKTLAETNTDVIALQETKCPDELFPHQVFTDAGYSYIHTHGMKGYNGVAIISRIPFTAENRHDRVGQSDCRHIQVTLTPDDCDPIEIHTLYVPAGGDIPDREENPKYGHKLDFVDEMTDWFNDARTTRNHAVTLGDFNIAPGEHDVWSSRQLRNVVSHTEPEITRINAMQSTGQWLDCARHFVPAEEKSYSWWSYRNRDWKKSNRGRRLDHIWVSPSLSKHLSAYSTLQQARDWEKPSDHIPIMIDLGKG